MIRIVKGFSIVSEAEAEVFLEFPCFFYDPSDVISGSSAFSKSSLYIWKFSVHILLKPSLKNFGHYLASMWNKHNGEGNGTLFQYSCLENPMDREAWWAAVHGVAKSLTWLSDFTFTLHFHALEKEMATHSSVLAWRIPGTWDPGGLLSMGLHRVGHDLSDIAAAAAAVCIS